MSVSVAMSLLRFLFILLRIAALVLVGAAVLLFFMQDGMIYFARAYEPGVLAAFAKRGGVALDFKRGSEKSQAYFLPPRDAVAADSGSAPIWLVCGGNGALALDYLVLADRGDDAWGFLFVDYPRYGACEGDPSPKSIDATIDGALDALAAHLGISRDALLARTFGFGHSIGAAAVLRAAADHGFRHVVAVAPFTAMIDIARDQVGFPLCHVLRHRFDNRAALGRFAARGGKATLFHGADDRQIPVSHGRELARLFPDAVTYHEIPSAGHNDLINLATNKIVGAMRGVVRGGGSPSS